MDLPDVPLLSMIKSRMSWLEARQNVLSQNVANADTPGYVAHDLKPMDFESLLKSASAGGGFNTGLMTTDSRHIAITPSNAGGFDSHASPDIEANPLGNSVSLEQEMIKVSDTQGQFQAASNLYSKAIQLMRTAIGRTS
ncbi:MAG: flagellar basal body rod protein FlgB [Alphaproteobacteria bacterium]|nr:flagellar basal body rod protein FlgB [Alphaproteobacteria bacterium]